MSDGISAPFIRYPIGTSLMMAGILFVGLVAYPLLPVAPLPQVDFPTIQVAASLPGGSPETMASSVAQPLERQLAQIPGIAQMTSTSYLGTAAVTIQFDLNRSIDGRSVIESGLSPGQQVITSGQYKVAPGALVSTAVASSDPAQPKVKQE